ncbi:hypothetical protein EB73_03200 [Mycobacterium sp. SWH-M3]|nr:hypothetical protein EB73_03200 [Mycobacterium sp. SWH-M3]
MFDTIATAGTIANDWPVLVGGLPKALADAVNVFEEAGYAQGPNVVVDASNVTVKNAQQAVADLADALAAADKFEEAKRRVRRELARQVLHRAGAAVPEVIEKIRPQFDKAVIEFTEAVNALPRNITSDELVNAGPAALAAYQRAAEAAQLIASVDHWLASLHGLPAYAGHKPDPTLRVLNPTSRDQLLALDGAQSKTDSDPYLRRLNPLYVAAVRAGIEFEMHTPRESVEIRQRIEAQPVERKPAGVVSFR